MSTRHKQRNVVVDHIFHSHGKPGLSTAYRCQPHYVLLSIVRFSSGARLLYSRRSRPSQDAVLRACVERPNCCARSAETKPHILAYKVQYTPRLPRDGCTRSLGLLRKFHPKDKMLEAPAVHLVAGLDSVVPICKADEGETLGQP